MANVFINGSFGKGHPFLKRISTQFIRFFFLLILSLVSFSTLKGQDWIHLFEASYKSPTIFVICEEGVIEDFISTVQNTRNPSESNYYIINGSNKAYEEVYSHINNILNSNDDISIQHVFYVVIGNSDFFKTYGNVSHDFFVDKFFFSTDGSLLDSQGFSHYDYKKLDLENLTSQMSKKYLWSVLLERVRSMNYTDHYSKKGKTSLGTGLNTSLLFTSNAYSFAPNLLTALNLNINQTLTNQWSLRLSSQVSRNIPDPEKIIRKEVVSQLDILSLISGGGSSQEIDLKFDIKAHLYAQNSFEFLYFLTSKPESQVYLGTGINYVLFGGLSIPIDTTVSISSNNLNSISGLSGFSPIGSIGFGDDSALGVINSIGIPLTIGMNKSLNNRWYLDANIQYQIDLDSFILPSDWFNSLSAGITLNYHFKGKKTTYFEYVRPEKED